MDTPGVCGQQGGRVKGGEGGAYHSRIVLQVQVQLRLQSQPQSQLQS